MTLFADRGYENTTVEDICAASGVSKSTFFNHHTSKADLLVENGRKFAEEWQRQASFLTFENAYEELKSFIEFIFCGLPNNAKGLPDTDLARAFVVDFITTNGRDFSTGEGPDTIHHQAQTILAAAQDQQYIKKTIPAEKLAHVMLLSCIQFYDFLEDEEPSQVADRYISFFMEGVAETSAPVTSPR